MRSLRRDPGTIRAVVHGIPRQGHRGRYRSEFYFQVVYARAFSLISDTCSMLFIEDACAFFLYRLRTRGERRPSQ